MGEEVLVPSFADVESAYNRIVGVVRHTPLLESPLLSRRLGRRVYVKAENLQITGSFKFRGASHRIGLLSEAELARGVVAYSSGNHGQAVAASCSGVGCVADIVMPSDAPSVKIELTESWGARVHLYDRERESREDIARVICERGGGGDGGGILVPPFDDLDIIAGQGSVGIELVEDCSRMGISPVAVLVPCGGGGLSAGISVVVERGLVGCGVWVVEPVGYDDTVRSLGLGYRVGVGGGGSLCDSLLAVGPGELTFAVNCRLVRGGFVVGDEGVVEAMGLLFDYFRLVVEPGGAVGLAALLGGCDLPDGDVVVVLSGGNVDRELFRDLVLKDNKN